MIKLKLINGRALTFSCDDYMKIRSKHHIVGKLIGIPVSHSRNLSWNGLPAIFSVYEVKLMLEQGIISLEEKGGLKHTSDSAKKEYERYQEQIVNELTLPYINSRLEATRANLDNIIKGKKKKLLLSGISEEGEEHG